MGPRCGPPVILVAECRIVARKMDGMIQSPRNSLRIQQMLLDSWLALGRGGPYAKAWVEVCGRQSIAILAGYEDPCSGRFSALGLHID